MTDTSDFMTAYARYREALKNANALNKTEVFDALAAAAITAVSVSFDGEGDSGQIDNVIACTDGTPAEIPAATVTLRKASWPTVGHPEDIHPKTLELPEAIEQLCYDYLEQEHGGWENNDGAFGEFQFDVANRSITLEFNGRYSDFLTSNHSL